MAELKDHEVTTYWIAHNSNDVIHFGEVEVGQVVTTGQPILEDFTDREAWKTRLLELGVDPDAEPETEGEEE